MTEYQALFMGMRFATTFFYNPKLFYMKINNLPVLAFEFSVLISLAVTILFFIRKYRDLRRFWVDYDIARLTGDKEKAFEAAKNFYKRKKGKLTMDDEQIIAGEINNMK